MPGTALWATWASVASPKLAVTQRPLAKVLAAQHRTALASVRGSELSMGAVSMSRDMGTVNQIPTKMIGFIENSERLAPKLG